MTNTAHGWWSRGWKRATTAILTVGALAAAVGAVISLWPAPDPEDTAQFTTVRTMPGVPLSEYRQRLEVVDGDQRVGLRSFRAGPSTPTDETTEESEPPATSDEDTESATPETTTSRPPRTTRSSTRPSTTSTAPSVSSTSPPSTTSTLPIGPARSIEGVQLPDRVPPETPRKAYSIAYSIIGNDPTSFASNSLDEARSALERVPYLIVSQCVTVDGDPVPPEVAAERVVTLLKDSRSSEPGGNASGRQEPIGVIVSVDVELTGLRGQEVMLGWSMWQAGGEARLHGEWLNRNLAYLLKPTTNHDTTTVDLWIPLPKPPGPYLVRVEMTTNGVNLDADESELID